jgi:hypothetical protein
VWWREIDYPHPVVTTNLGPTHKVTGGPETRFKDEELLLAVFVRDWHTSVGSPGAAHVQCMPHTLSQSLYVYLILFVFV